MTKNYKAMMRLYVNKECSGAFRDSRLHSRQPPGHVVSDTIQPIALLPQVVSSAEDEVGFGVEGGAHLAQPALAAGTLQAVFMPELIQGLQQVAVLYLAVAAGAAFGLGVRLNREHLYSWKE